ncbi:AI-2E family transporter [uncultured archaeon]|nr:AI-2E family transporter [uncultured archaeon]
MLSSVLAAIGFSLLGIRYPIILGAIVAYFTFVPMLGPPLVFIILALYYLFLGETLHFLILIFGTVVAMIIPENVIRPHLAMKSSQIPPDNYIAFVYIPPYLL